jgi:hypothetical protein
MDTTLSPGLFMHINRAKIAITHSLHHEPMTVTKPLPATPMSGESPFSMLNRTAVSARVLELVTGSHNVLLHDHAQVLSGEENVTCGSGGYCSQT